MARLTRSDVRRILSTMRTDELRRLIAIDVEPASREGLQIGTPAERFGVSPKTIGREMDVLRSHRTIVCKPIDAENHAGRSHRRWYADRRRRVSSRSINADGHLLTTAARCRAAADEELRCVQCYCGPDGATDLGFRVAMTRAGRGSPSGAGISVSVDVGAHQPRIRRFLCSRPRSAVQCAHNLPRADRAPEAGRGWGGPASR